MKISRINVMNWSESQRNEIIDYVNNEFEIANVDSEANTGIFAVLMFCRISSFNKSIYRGIKKLKNKKIVLLEERERGKVWAGAYLQNGMVTFKTFDSQELTKKTQEHGIPYPLFEKILVEILEKYPSHF